MDQKVILKMFHIKTETYFKKGNRKMKTKIQKRKFEKELKNSLKTKWARGHKLAQPGIPPPRGPASRPLPSSFFFRGPASASPSLSRTGPYPFVPFFFFFFVLLQPPARSTRGSEDRGHIPLDPIYKRNRGTPAKP
jgi:hypothetical protein